MNMRRCGDNYGGSRKPNVDRFAQGFVAGAPEGDTGVDDARNARV